MKIFAALIGFMCLAFIIAAIASEIHKQGGNPTADAGVTIGHDSNPIYDVQRFHDAEKGVNCYTYAKNIFCLKE